MTYSLTRWPVVRKSTRKSYRPMLRVITREPMAQHKRSHERRVYVHGEPLPLVIPGRNTVAAWACANCGKVHSAKYDRPDRTGARTMALECCRRPHSCSGCGVQMGREHAKCDSCFSRDAHGYDRRRARKATIVEDSGDPVWSPHFEGEWRDGYSSCLDAHLAAWADENAGNHVFVPPAECMVLRLIKPWGDYVPADPDYEPPAPPPFVFCCSSITAQVCQQSIDESLSEEMHDDFEACDLPGYEELASAIEAFNAAQKPTSWQTDYTRVIVIDRTRFDAYLATEWDGRPDIKWRGPADPIAARPMAQVAEKTAEQAA